MSKIILFLVMISLLLSCSEKDKNTCTIIGKVIGYDDCKTLLLYKSHQDPQYLSTRITLDKDHCFKFTIDELKQERYSLVCEEAYNSGFGYMINFFPDSGKTIKFRIYPADRLNEIQITGSELSAKLLDFEKSEKKWLDDNPYKKNANRDSIAKIFFGNKIKFITENQNLAGYSMLVQLFNPNDYFHFVDKNELLKIAESFQKIFPLHPYSEVIETIKRITVGNISPIFSATDTLGQIVDFSNVISANKITLLDLWAPWCRPCLEKGREMIPVYTKFKDSGFGIIGVVGGIQNIDSFKDAVAKENFPWQNLREINNENRIWEKFNIMNSGGATFLIDNKGVILAINPTIEETEKIILQKL